VADRLSPAYGCGEYERVIRLHVGTPVRAGERVIARLAVRDPLVELKATRTVTVTIGRGPIGHSQPG
jgi:hypothetical protein